MFFDRKVLFKLLNSYQFFPETTYVLNRIIWDILNMNAVFSLLVEKIMKISVVVRKRQYFRVIS